MGRIIPSKHLKNHFENSDKLGDKNPRKMTQEKKIHIKSVNIFYTN